MAASISHLKQTPWCAALINDPEWTPTRTASRTPKPPPGSEDSFCADTLGTERTIRHWLTLRPKKEEDENPAFRSVRTIMELGDGLNGHPQILHGGFVGTMLDEVMGVLITLNLEKKMERLKKEGRAPGLGLNCFTAYLHVNYKKPVPGESTLLCTATWERQEGRKIYVKGTIEDGNGTIYTTGEGMFVEVQRRARL